MPDLIQFCVRMDLNGMCKIISIKTCHGITDLSEGGILQAYRQEETGMVIFTLVPDMVLNQGMTQILIVLLTIYAVIAVLAFVLSLYASQTFTRPIRQIFSLWSVP